MPLRADRVDRHYNSRARLPLPLPTSYGKSHSMSEPPTRERAGFQRHQVGAIVVTALSDGYLDVPYQVMQQIGEQEARQILAGAQRRGPPRVSINAFALASGGRVALIETGA